MGIEDKDDAWARKNICLKLDVSGIKSKNLNE